MDGVGPVVRRLREAKGWSQAKLAGETGMAVSGVSQIENGKRNPNSATLLKLARALGVEVADLFPKEARLPLDNLGPRTLEELLERASIETRWQLLPSEEFDRWWLGISREEATRRYWEIWAEYEVIRDEWRAVNQGASTAAPELQAEMFGIWYEAFKRTVLGASFVAPQKGESEEEFEARRREGANVFTSVEDVEKVERDPHELVAGGAPA